MASIDDLSLRYRLFMRNYAFARYAIPDSPCAPMTKPLSECRVALVTTAGLHEADDVPFDSGIKGGDTSFRDIRESAVTRSLVESHKSDAFDHGGIEADRNLAFPLDRIRELAAQGVIGDVAPRHVSFMGSVTKPETLIDATAPAAARLLVGDGVDVALLTPV